MSQDGRIFWTAALVRHGWWRGSVEAVEELEEAALKWYKSNVDVGSDQFKRLRLYWINIGSLGFKYWTARKGVKYVKAGESSDALITGLGNPQITKAMSRCEQLSWETLSWYRKLWKRSDKPNLRPFLHLCLCLDGEPSDVKVWESS